MFYLFIITLAFYSFFSLISLLSVFNICALCPPHPSLLLLKILMNCTPKFLTPPCLFLCTFITQYYFFFLQGLGNIFLYILFILWYLFNLKHSYTRNFNFEVTVHACHANLEYVENFEYSFL